MAYINTHLGDGSNTVPHVDRKMPGLTPATDEKHKKCFYVRARSQIIAHSVFGHFKKSSINRLMHSKKHFTWYDDRNDPFYDGSSMVKIIMDA